MISFTIITSTPLVLKNQLIARGIIQEIIFEGSPRLVGVRRGVEWVEVQNPIMTSLPSGTVGVNYVFPVMDTRRCYLVKMANAAEDDETAGEVRDNRSLLLRTKLGKWIMANSVADTLVSVNGKSWPSRLVGANFWFVDSPDFGVWQQ